jgi:hypothetical protein
MSNREVLQNRRNVRKAIISILGRMFNALRGVIYMEGSGYMWKK